MHIFKHFITVVRHRHLVMKYAFKAGIPCQGLVHDLSKFNCAEFMVGAKYYQEHRSPNEKERREKGYSSAWLHHQGRNKHHFEFWIDYDPITKRLAPIEMPRKYLVEMFCDRLAASRTYQGKDYKNSDPWDYLQRSKDRIMMNEKTKAELEFLLTMLKDEGEKAVFSYIRKHKKDPDAFHVKGK